MIWTILILLLITYKFLDWYFRSLSVGSYGNRHVFITGCDSGFGRELAIHLDHLGFCVFAGCLTREGSKSLSDICSSNLITVSLDVTNDDSIDAAVQLVKQRLSDKNGLWALINNAGIPGILSKSELCTKQDFQHVMDINLLGPVEMTRKFLPLIRKAQGRIVNMTSVLGRCAAMFAPYCSAKFGLEAFSDVIRREVYRQGIKVSLLEPGFFRTNILNYTKMVSEIRHSFERASPEVQETYGSDFIQKFEVLISDLERNSAPSTKPVLDAYTHAVTARFPRTRYVIGTDARFIYTPLSYLPDWFSDALLKALFRKYEKSGNGK